MISLFGVIAGFVVHMLAAAAGITALLLTIPLGFQILKWAGAAYLAWLAWQALKPGARSPFERQLLPADPPRKLFLMGGVLAALALRLAFEETPRDPHLPR